VDLPASFPPDTEFADVEGVPVSFEPKTGRTTAWDVASGRPFPFDSLKRNGTALSETVFRSRFKVWPQGVQPRDWGQRLVDNLNRNVMNDVPTN